MSYDVNLVIQVAKKEIGYLQKKSNTNLDDKTANAGSNNYTKYWRDLKPTYQEQSWCDAFVSWCFLQAYGREAANELLCGGLQSYYTPTSAQYFKKKNQWYSRPKVGDIIYFKNSSRICHTGIVIRVTNVYVYTIEGNTGGASGVIENGGGVCEKAYALTNSRIAGYGRPNYMATSATTSTNDSSLLKKGSQGSEVKAIQTKLIAIGYSCGSAGADGDFGNGTETAVKKFQKDYNLEVDGIVGNETKKALNTAYTKKMTNTKVVEGIADSFDRSIAGTYYTATALNLRKGASKNFAIIAVMPRGAKVQCYGYHTNDWYYVTYGNYTGFCMKQYLTK